MISFEWTHNGIQTNEEIKRSTPMEFVTVKVDPGQLCRELSLDDFANLDERACIVLEHICTDALYVILVIAQRQLSSHNRKLEII